MDLDSVTKIKLLPFSTKHEEDEWNEEYNQLFSDPWIAKKLDRKRRLREHLTYIKTYIPEMLTADSSNVADIGCGAGELLEILRAHGHNVEGVDSPLSSTEGMGHKYVRASMLMHKRQQLKVSREGFKHWLGSRVFDQRKYKLINFRGSFSQCNEHMQFGPPHGETQNSKLLSWKTDIQTKEKLRLTMAWMSHFMTDDGAILISMNESKNQDRFDEIFTKVLHECGLSTERPDRLVYKIKKSPDCS